MNSTNNILQDLFAATGLLSHEPKKTWLHVITMSHAAPAAPSVLWTIIIIGKGLKNTGKPEAAFT